MTHDHLSQRERLSILRRYARRSHGQRDKWSRFERVSKALAIVAVPVVLAVAGFALQHQLQNETVKRDYVQLAVSILKEPNQSAVKPEIRAWAVDLLRATSPMPFSEDVANRLKSGETTIVGEHFTSISSPCLTPDVDARLRAALGAFQAYLRTSGFNIASGEVQYEAAPGNVMHERDGDFVALWDPEANTMRVACGSINDTDLILHEYMRHVLVPEFWYAPNTGDDSQWHEYYAIDSGLAVYFPCTFNNRPIFGRPGETQSLLNTASLAESAMNTNQEKVGQAWASAFWDLRSVIGAQTADRILASAWSSWRPSVATNLKQRFVRRILLSDRTLGGQHSKEIVGVFARRDIHI